MNHVFRTLHYLLIIIFVVYSEATSFSSTRKFGLKLVTKRLNVNSPFQFEEATISNIQEAFNDGQLTSQQLIEHYLEKIKSLNPYLNAIIEVNPDAIEDAIKADLQRSNGVHKSNIHGIPILIKDNINTHDKLNTTSGSYALLGSIVPRDAGVIRRLRKAGAIILGKASMSEWDNFRSVNIPVGWSPRGGQGRNPYNKSVGPCGTSSGSAIAVAANLVTVSLGSDVAGAITCPAIENSVVGIKPTVGLTSRSGTISISPRLDTIGPIARTVADAVALLDVIVGFDPMDAEATKAAEKFIPKGGFQKFLKVDGLKGKRVGILRHIFKDAYPKESLEAETFANHFRKMRLKGAILIDNLKIKNFELMNNLSTDGEAISLLAEFKLSINAYLKNLLSSPVRSLSDIIDFNNNHQIEEKIDEYGQIVFLDSQKTNGIGIKEKNAIEKMVQLSKGMDDLMREKMLDVVVFPENNNLDAFATGGFPIINVPAGYNSFGVPFGICFSGLSGSDATLIEIAYAFEQATQVRKPPSTQLF